MERETIFALGSGGGVAGVSVIRASGNRVRTVLERLCGDLPTPRRAAYRSIKDPHTGQKIDSGLILFFPAPHSFTGEDVAEFQVHGSRAVVREMLRCLGDMDGLRAATAGEFTMRAFRNGRMDLLEVEALSDLLAADSMMQARFAFEAQDRLRALATTWRDRILELRALTEAYIDFSDEDDILRQGETATAEPLTAMIAELSSAIDSFYQGERIRNGFRVAILGAPNAGKSSLLNALARRDVAIVSEEAGTTRDILEVHLELEGYPIVLTDTAGIRETMNDVEREGIRRARENAARSDLRLWLSAADNRRAPDVANCILVETKADLIDSYSTQTNKNYLISTKTGQGLDNLISMLGRQAQTALAYGQDVIVGHERQRNALVAARSALKRAAQMPAGMLELRSEELRQAERALESLIGRIDYEDVLGEVFSRFCIGK